MPTRTVPARHLGGRCFEATRDVVVDEGATVELRIETHEATRRATSEPHGLKLGQWKLGVRRWTRDELYDELA